MTAVQPSAPERTERDREKLRAVHAALTSGDVARAGVLAAEALAAGIEHPMVLSLAAGRLEEAGRRDEALPLLRRAKALAPQAPGMWNAIGLCLSGSGRYAEAVEEFDGAIALDRRFAPALANRGNALMALGRLNEARRDFEQALALDPNNMVTLDGLAALSLRRGDASQARDLAERALARVPDFPNAIITLAGAELAQGEANAAEQRLRRLLADPRPRPRERALAAGLLGDALDRQKRFAEAFQVYTDTNYAFQELHRPEFADQFSAAQLLRDLTPALEGERFPNPPERTRPQPARTHVFLVGFPRSGTTLLEQVLEQHPDVTTLAEKDCFDDVGALMGDRSRFEAFCRMPDAALDPCRDAYWKRVAEAGVNANGRVLVDKHPFHTFKLPLIARLFPDAHILFARRDPRDTILSCFRHRFAMSAPMYQLLTLDGAAELFDAAMHFAEASIEAFSLAPIPCALEAVVADFDGETRRICAALGIEWTAAMRDFAAEIGRRDVLTPSGPQLARGLNAEGIGRWRDYAGQLAPVMPMLMPWVERAGYASAGTVF
ncbi:MAG TPA: sulfotransferase [Allosphingosinicella sp.]|jgi:tetratricopeptide (TPR) repeat protein|nr:sulfotransferase [Allosphingosinicella sp.]